MSSSNRVARGFSLVEVLVVVAILGVLLAFLMPTIQRARDRAQQTKCAAQLHGIGIALAAYAADHAGSLPGWGGWHTYPPGSSPDDEPGDAWTTQLTPYLAPPDSPAYHCPSIGDRQLVTYFIAARWSGAHGRNFMRLGDVRLSTLFVLGGEQTNFRLYLAPVGTLTGLVGDDIDPDDARLPSACFPGDPGGFLAHPGGNNLLFGDGHVAAFVRDEPAQMTFDPKQMRSWYAAGAP